MKKDKLLVCLTVRCDKSLLIFFVVAGIQTVVPIFYICVELGGRNL